MTDDEKRAHFTHLRDTATDSLSREYWQACLEEVGSTAPISHPDPRWEQPWTKEMCAAVAYWAPHGPFLK